MEPRSTCAMEISPVHAGPWRRSLRGFAAVPRRWLAERRRRRLLNDLSDHLLKDLGLPPCGRN